LYCGIISLSVRVHGASGISVLMLLHETDSIDNARPGMAVKMS